MKSDPEIKFHPHSFADPRIRLFYLNGQLYRGVASQCAPLFRELFRTGLIDKLVAKGILIESELTDLKIADYELVIHHRNLDFNSYPIEWCAATLKDAALVLLELSIELAEHGYTLIDGHPWNLAIDIERCCPVYVDLGSIIKISSPIWKAYDEFCRYCLYALLLMSHGQSEVARQLMAEERGVLWPDILGLTSYGSRWERIKYMLYKQPTLSSLCSNSKKKLNSFVLELRDLIKISENKPMSAEQRKQRHSSFLRDVRDRVKNISLQHEDVARIKCDEYRRALKPAIESMPEREHALHQLLAKLQCQSVLDVGTGTGHFAKLAVRMGHPVVAIDTDEKCIAQIYYEAKCQRLNILPLVLDFAKPTPSRGLGNHWTVAATERLQCDVAMALDVIPELVLMNRLTFDQIAEGMALFSKKAAIAEYVPLNTLETKSDFVDRYSWYSCDNLTKSLKQRFRHVSVLPAGFETRKFIVCEK